MTSFSIVKLIVIYLSINQILSFKITPVKIRRRTDIYAEPGQPKMTFAKLVQLIGLGAGK